MQSRPTELAQDNFQRAYRAAVSVWPPNTDKGDKGNINAVSVSLAVNLGQAIGDLARGLDHMAVALRATYMLLEKIDKDINTKKMS
jgi:hypothetical protein